ncbi:MAG: SAM-dependent methyltransferase [Hydrogenibacillus sp.]|nr:SAM-dependent methyltransferase [Hydrogenibacillus sp.]
MSSRGCQARLRAALKEAGGAIGFGTWMRIALYDPECGYYMQDREKIGPRGDFYTSSNVGAVYGAFWARVWTRRFETRRAKARSSWHVDGPGGSDIESEAPETYGDFWVIELGAGDGRFAASALDALSEERADVYRRLRYIAVEASSAHAERLLQRTKAHASRVTVVSDIAELERLQLQRTDDDARFASPPVKARPEVVLFANEFYDAHPVERLIRRGGAYYWTVVRETGTGFRLDWSKDVPPAVLAYAERYGHHFPDDHVFEAPLSGLETYRTLTARFPHGLFITVDYGLDFAELAVPARRNGTVVGFRHHALREDWFDHPGEMDITAWVPFEAYREAGEAAGLTTLAYTTQGAYLAQNGIFDFLRETLADEASRDPFHPKARQNRAVRMLIAPEGFGAAFRVLVQAGEP